MLLETGPGKNSCPDSDTCTCLAHSGGKACPGLVKHGQNLRLSGLNQSHFTIFHPYPAVVKLCRTWQKSYADSGFIWYYRLIFCWFQIQGCIKSINAKKTDACYFDCLLPMIYFMLGNMGRPNAFTILARCQRGSCKKNMKSWEFIQWLKLPSSTGITIWLFVT